MRWLPLVAVAAVGCGGTEPPPATPTPGPHWPGPVAFAAERDGSLDIFVRDGDRTRRLTKGKRDEFSPNWSGDRIVYRVNPPRDDAGDIWLMRSDGSGKRNLTRSPDVPDWSPAFSPDGRALAFSGHRGGDFEILRIDAAGGEERNLTNTPGDDKWPSWSPDGKQIAFISDDDVYVMAADGSNRRNVSRSGLYENHPSWTSDGRLTFLQHGESGPVHVRVVDRPSYDLPIDAVFVYDWR